MDKDLYPIKDAVSQLSHTASEQFRNLERANIEQNATLKELQRKIGTLAEKISEVEKTLIRQQTQRNAEGNVSNSLYDIKNQLNGLEKTVQDIQQQILQFQKSR